MITCDQMSPKSNSGLTRFKPTCLLSKHTLATKSLVFGHLEKSSLLPLHVTLSAFSSKPGGHLHT